MRIFLIVLGFILLFLGFYALGTWIFMLIWNAVLPPLFHWPRLTFWYAAGICFLLGCVGGMFKATTSSK